MKRNIYIALCVVALLLLAYTAYFAMSTKTTPVTTQAPVATSTLVIATTTPSVEKSTTYTTKSGKKIKITETNPIGESLSTITIDPMGFSTNTPIVLDTNKLTNSLYVDLNKDSFEELIITTVSQGSGSFGEVFIFTTASTSMLLPVRIPEMSEADTEKGGLFEGYMGHDSYSIVSDTLIREFPTFKKTDTNSEPTGPRRSIIYSLVKKDMDYTIVFIKGTTTASVLSTATSTVSP